MNQWILIIVALIICGLLLLIAAFYLRRKAFSPNGKIIYEDITRLNDNQVVLYSQKYAIAGKPDLVIQGKNQAEYWPVEIKSINAPEHPYRSHVMQLIAYCLLVEENYHIQLSFGELWYRNKKLQIPYTKQKREELLLIVEKMRCTFAKEIIPPRCDQPNKCAACSFREQCESGEFDL